MAMRINTGYDFQATEIPTKEKFNQMAAGLEITNIPPSQLDAAMITLHTTNGSGLSLGEGGLWVNDLGEIMINTRFGRLALYRVNGGWETRRYNVQHNGTNLPNFGNVAFPGQGRYRLRNNPSNGQDESTQVFFAFDRDTAAGNVMNSVNIDTAPSGGNARMCMRGGVFYTPDESARAVTALQYATNDNVVASDLTTPYSRLPTSTVFTQAPVFGLFTRNVGVQDLSFGWIYGLLIARH